MSYAGEMAGRGEQGRARRIYSTRYLSVSEGLEPVGEVARSLGRSVGHSLARSSGGLGGSRTKLLKMDEISDLPASGLPARSSQAIRQVPR